jgi:hypothetical protein
MKYRIQAMWNDFAHRVLPPHAAAIQRKEMRRAFYAGASAMLDRLSGEMSPGDTLDDPNDERVVKEVQAEFVEFAEAIKRGEA